MLGGRSTFATALGLACTLGASSAYAAETRAIELFSTNDIHGHLEPSAFKAHHGHVTDPPTIGGGLLLLSGFIKNARARYGARMVLVDGGDLFQGTLASNMTEGAAMVRGLNRLGYAAGALGNHEFDYGPIGPKRTPATSTDDPRGALAARMKDLSFPIVSANVLTAAGKPFVKPYVIHEVDGVALGIVGGTTANLFSTTVAENLTGLHVEPLAPAIIAAGKDAVAHGARVLIAVVHAGAECTPAPRAITDRDPEANPDCSGNQEAVALAHALADSAANGGPRFSAIAAGHTHEPITMVVDGIPIIESGHAAQYLSHVSIEVTGRGADAKPTGRFAIERTLEVCTRLDARGLCPAVNDQKTHPQTWLGPIAPDPAVEAAVAQDVGRAHELADRKLGVTLPDGLMETYAAENPLGNFVADTLRAVTKADIGLMNGGGMRTPLPRGVLTFGALYETFPFDNDVIAVDMTGDQLLHLAERNLTSVFATLSWSGVRLHARCEAGRLHLAMTLSDGRPLDPHAHYRLGTIDFLAHGGDDMVARASIVGTGYGSIRNVLEKAFAAHGGRVEASEFFDPANRRQELAQPRPLPCRP